MSAIETTAVEERLLDAAERLYYAKSVQGVGMDELRAEAGIPLKRIYQLHPSKESIVVAMLRRRDLRWRGLLEAHVEAVSDPRKRVLAVFEWLQAWFDEPAFHGCAWVNAYGELGETTPAIAEEVRSHQEAFRSYVARLVAEAGASKSTGRALFLLAEGAIVTAAIDGSSKPGKDARKAAQRLLDAD